MKIEGKKIVFEDIEDFRRVFYAFYRTVDKVKQEDILFKMVSKVGDENLLHECMFFLLEKIIDYKYLKAASSDEGVMSKKFKDHLKKKGISEDEHVKMAEEFEEYEKTKS